MIRIAVALKDEEFAKQQIAAFEKIKEGKWRYSGVFAWRGIVCELLTSKWLAKKYNVIKTAKGLDDSGIVDDYDLIVHNKKVEIKSATKNHFKFLMPKIHDVQNKPKDIYIGVKYDETVTPNEIEILGFIERKDILKFPIKQNKGAPYYEIPLAELRRINFATFR